jgi:hypothetical protein
MGLSFRFDVILKTFLKVIRPMKISVTSKLDGVRSWSLEALDTCPGSIAAPGVLVDACAGCYATTGITKKIGSAWHGAMTWSTN